MAFALVGLMGCGGGEEVEEVPAEAPEVEAPAGPAATEVQALQLQTGAAALAGQQVRVNGLKVVSSLGDRAFWIELPNKNPFLVITQEPTNVSQQATVDVVGRVVVMTPEILNEWVSSGRITENQRLEAEFATEFLEADQVMPSGA